MKTLFLSIAVVSFSLIATGCAGLGYSGVVIPVSGIDKGAQRFYKAENLLGCATIVSLSNTNQSPTYDEQYELQFNSTGSGDVAGLAVQGGLVGMAAAVITTVAVDAAMDATRTAKREIKMVNVPKDYGLVKAVRLKMDDGREISLPMLNASRWDASNQYKVGTRYQVFYSQTYDNIQLFASREKLNYQTPGEAARARDWYCKSSIEEAKVQRLLEINANRIDETKIY